MKVVRGRLQRKVDERRECIERGCTRAFSVMCMHMPQSPPLGLDLSCVRVINPQRVACEDGDPSGYEEPAAPPTEGDVRGV